MTRIATVITLLALLGGCALRERRDPAYFQIQAGRLPPADVTLDIPGLGPCTDSPDRRLRLDSSQPINVLVHGCFGSSGQFRGLAQVLAFHGQQSACFTYDDRAQLTRSATQLRRAVDELADRTRTVEITLIGHSQGALIARKSLTEGLLTPPPVRGADLRLVTISGPFDGIASARTCGRAWLRPLTLGMLPGLCYLVTGAKWSDITYSSRFIREPGALAPRVTHHLKIDTDERGSCRRWEGERCVEDDHVFSVREQRNPLVEADPRSLRVEVKAGHVEIVGDKRVAPTKLLTILQEQGVLRPTAPERLADLGRLLAHVYRDNAPRDQGGLVHRSQP